jgi:hypothetical protein
MKPYAIQGDILFKQINLIPKGAKKKNGKTVAYGEATGHHHSFRFTDDVQLYELGDRLFAHIGTPAIIEHEEHNDIPFETGDYEIKRQREYVSRDMVRVVID